MCSACEVSASSVPILGNQDLLRNPQCAVRARSRHAVFWQTSTLRCPPTQPTGACVLRPHGWKLTGSRLDRSSGCCVVASVARLMPAAGHRIARDLESLVEGWHHSIAIHASPCATQRQKQKDDLTDETLKSAQKPEKIDGKPGRNKNWNQMAHDQKTLN